MHVTDTRIDAESRDALLARHSQKWRLYPSDVIAMHVAEMDYPVAEPVRRALGDMIAHSDMGYLGPIPEFAPAFEAFATSRWGWTPDMTNARLATARLFGVLEVVGRTGHRDC